jgi:hypothetical protein
LSERATRLNTVAYLSLRTEEDELKERLAEMPRFDRGLRLC